MRIPSFAALFLAAIALAPAGCNQTARSICRQRCECTPCTPTDEQACLDEADTAATRADTSGCATQLDAVLSCLEEHLSCQSGSGPGTDKCDQEQASLFTCAGFSDPFATTCDEAATKVAKCSGSTTPPQTGSMCPASAACSAQCLLDVSCDVITGVNFSQSFQTCVNVCNNPK
jgi:hypothetical protein